MYWIEQIAAIMKQKEQDGLGIVNELRSRINIQVTEIVDLRERVEKLEAVGARISTALEEEGVVL